MWLCGKPLGTVFHPQRYMRNLSARLPRMLCVLGKVTIFAASFSLFAETVCMQPPRTRWCEDSQTDAHEDQKEVKIHVSVSIYFSQVS